MESEQDYVLSMTLNLFSGQHDELFVNLQVWFKIIQIPVNPQEE